MIFFYDIYEAVDIYDWRVLMNQGFVKYSTYLLPLEKVGRKVPVLII